MKAQTKRQEQKADTRRALIETAQRLFERQGIAATNTAQIAKATGVSHGTVFLHFPAREDLILAVIDDFGSRLSDELTAALGNEIHLEKILDAHLTALGAFGDFYFRLLTELCLLPAAVRGTVFMLNAAVSKRMAAAAQPRMQTGELKNLEPHWMFNTWIALLHYYIVNRDQLGRGQGAAIKCHFLQLIENTPKG